MAGTDSSPIWSYGISGYSLHSELELYVKAGMTAYEALKTATLNPAVFLHAQHDFGSVEKGKIADLVLLNENPFYDITNTRKINAVIISGKFLDRKQLDALLQQAKTEAHNYPNLTR